MRYLVLMPWTLERSPVTAATLLHLPPGAATLSSDRPPPEAAPITASSPGARTPAATRAPATEGGAHGIIDS